MKALDRLLQNWRMRIAARHLPDKVRLIDIGAHRGELFEYLGRRLEKGFGIEPLASAPLHRERFEIHPGYFPRAKPGDGPWDAITMLAVLEHIPASETRALAVACYNLLRPGGLVIITVPAPMVDSILWLLGRLRLIDGMSLEEHHGYRPEETPQIFAHPQFGLVVHRRFQLGCNHLFVFRRNP
jgi:2-polyprenyl-3-methyl-5-hydroxy-6-metoxy-1,4-benzoquinol methylase